MDKGFVKLIKSNKDITVKSALIDLQAELANSGSSDDLIGIIKRALDVTTA